MIDSVKNRAAIVTDVLDDGSLGETTLHTMDDRVVGFRQSDGRTLQEMDFQFFQRRKYHPMRKRRRPKPKEGGVRSSFDHAGVVARPSVLKAMEELRQHVERQFPT